MISCTMFSHASTRKLLVGACAVMCIFVVMLTMSQKSSMLLTCLHPSDEAAKKKEIITSPVMRLQRKDQVNNDGASEYLSKYDHLFNTNKQELVVPADPNKPDTITKWWQAAAMIDWYIHSPIRYECTKRVAMGNWHICQDEPYTVKPPCLVYSFGINWDFSFDDDMEKLGCEVHSFDPSMNMSDHKRGNNSRFYNMGLGSINTDGFIARQDPYVTGTSVWKMRTVKAIMELLGHQNRVIDVFKMDVEGYEWGILDNMIETNVFKNIRQYMLEYHLFSNFPLKEEYVYIYKTATRLREMGFQEFSVAPHPKTLDLSEFNNQGDSEYINAFFEKQAR